jgi:hypothetical protein
MKISIAGSWKEKDIPNWDLRAKSSFIEACSDIGKVIGKCNGAELIVNSGREDTADIHVVRGIIDSVKNKDKLQPFRVWGIFPKNESSPFENLTQEELGYLDLKYDLIQLPYKTEAHFKSVDAADIIITIGGGFTTYLSGSYAMLSKKKIVPIGSFGGASKKILDKVLQIMGNSIWGRADLENLSRDWSPQVLSSVRMLVKEFPLVWIIHGRAKKDLNDLNNLLKQLHVRTVVMEDEFVSGKTPTEKFEGLASRVQGAIILATPDDVGALKKKNGSALKLKERARQNLWLEVGWFWAALGREKLLFLKRGSIEIPSDWGIVYEHLPIKKDTTKIREFVNGIGKG